MTMKVDTPNVQKYYFSYKKWSKNSVSGSGKSYWANQNGNTTGKSKLLKKPGMTIANFIGQIASGISATILQNQGFLIN